MAFINTLSVARETLHYIYHEFFKIGLKTYPSHPACNAVFFLPHSSHMLFGIT